jgi:hypothetical protein
MRPPCKHLGHATKQTVPAALGDRLPLTVYQCSIWGKCTQERMGGDLLCCKTCKEYVKPEEPKRRTIDPNKPKISINQLTLRRKH